MTEQPAEEPVAIVNVFIFKDRAESEVDTNPGNLSFKELAKRFHMIARDYERWHQQEKSKNARERNTKKEDGNA